ncbi:MAG: hypothetical protein J6P07_04340, partial [Spirochaetaceae bacterium]|nr:hypothetical protein [Spirochaetaceae bacterium]
RRISSIRKIFKENKQSIAIIIDEYSGTSGLVTIANLTQEIFGSVYQEPADTKNESGGTSEDSFTVDGSMRLSELSEKIGFELKSEFYDTVGGFITEKLGDFPQIDSEIKLDFGSLVVKKLDGYRVETVLVNLKFEAEDEK